MSTIPSASPRPSISSRRTSTSTADATIPDRGAARRNKAAALRDYYNLQHSSNSLASPPATPTSRSPPPHTSELDQPSFSPTSYVNSLLQRENLSEILKIESGLLTEIRSLDGEKKALVYDNYSKLISATETIRRMREGMGDPMQEERTRGLVDTVGEIAVVAGELDGEMKKVGRKGSINDSQRTVKWVLDAPDRLSGLSAEDAKAEWIDVERLLGKWAGVKGTEDVRKRCVEVLRSKDIEAVK